MPPADAGPVPLPDAERLAAAGCGGGAARGGIGAGACATCGGACGAGAAARACVGLAARCVAPRDVEGCRRRWRMPRRRDFHAAGRRSDAKAAVRPAHVAAAECARHVAAAFGGTACSGAACSARGGVAICGGAGRCARSRCAGAVRTFGAFGALGAPCAASRDGWLGGAGCGARLAFAGRHVRRIRMIGMLLPDRRGAARGVRRLAALGRLRIGRRSRRVMPGVPRYSEPLRCAAHGVRWVGGGIGRRIRVDRARGRGDAVRAGRGRRFFLCQRRRRCCGDTAMRDIRRALARGIAVVAACGSARPARAKALGRRPVTAALPARVRASWSAAIFTLARCTGAAWVKAAVGTTVAAWRLWKLFSVALWPAKAAAFQSRPLMRRA